MDHRLVECLWKFCGASHFDLLLMLGDCSYLLYQVAAQLASAKGGGVCSSL